jgi:hypothetical protein
MNSSVLSVILFRASAAEWLRLLTSKYLPLTVVGLSRASDERKIIQLSLVSGSYLGAQLCLEKFTKGHLRSSSTSKAGNSPYDLYCVGAMLNPMKGKKSVLLNIKSCKNIIMNGH